MIMFNDPYIESENNHWNEPYLNGYVQRLRNEIGLRRTFHRLKTMFLTEAQALIHCDLHTGSIMVTEDSTKVIDPESPFSARCPLTPQAAREHADQLFQPHGLGAGAGRARRLSRLVQQTTVSIWELFAQKFLALWRDPALATGDGYPAALFHDEAGRLSSSACAASTWRSCITTPWRMPACS